MNFLLLYLLIFLNLNNYTGSIEENLDLLIEIEKDGQKFQKDLIEFITENNNNINTSDVKSKAVMVLGLSGTGKSTLINYLNDVPLICTKNKNKKWIIEPQNKSLTPKMNIAKIGHNVYSQTFLPNSYSPLNEDFSYIDNPGFKDTRGVSFEIANGFFREKITSNVSDLKFLLLLEDSDLRYSKAQQFRDTIKAFSSFIDLFNTNFDIKKAEQLSKSIGIIITKVDNEGETDLEMKEILRDQLNETISDEIEHNNLNEIEQLVFLQIIENFQIEIFSNPKKKGPVSTDQKKKIIELVKKLEYIKKNEYNTQTRIEESSKSKLLNYIKNKFKLFEKNFNEKFFIDISNYFEQKYQDFKEAPFIFNELIELVENGKLEHDFENYTNSLNNKILSPNDKEEMFSKKKAITFFDQFMTNDDRDFFVWKKKWMSEKTKSKLDFFISDILQNLSSKCDLFLESIKEKIKNELKNFFETSINQAEDLNDLMEMEDFLKNFKNLIRVTNDFDYFFKNASEIIVNKINKEKFADEKEIIFNLVYVLSDERKKQYLNMLNFKNIRQDLIEELENLENELKNLRTENSFYKDGVFTYIGYFANMSSILEKINFHNEIVDLRSVSVYSAISLIFNDDFVIVKERYINHAPDLVIISPKVICLKEINIDLSSQHTPGYPDQKEKADNGKGYGQDGKDGKPGLPGYSGGNLLIISEKNLGFNLTFISNGGIGGPGQEGGNGVQGRKGKDALLSDIQIDQSKSLRSPDPVNKTYIYNSSFDDGSWKFSKYIEFAVDGEAGSNGGNSGKGGQGGVNGINGEYIFIDKEKVYVGNANGSKKHLLGIPGLQGSPGRGGQFGNTAIKTYYYWQCNWLGGSLSLGLACIHRSTATGFYNEYDKLVENKKINSNGSFYKLTDEDKILNKIDLKYNETSFSDLKINKSTSSSGFLSEFNRIVVSIKFSSNGSDVLRKNKNGLTYAKKKDGINIEEKKNEYLNYLSTLNTKLTIVSHHFMNSIINIDYFSTNISDQIEKVKILSKFKKLNSTHLINLKHLINNYYKQKFSSNNELTILNYIQATILSLISRQKSKHEKVLLIDLEKFLESSISQIKTVKELTHQNVRNFYLKTYENNLNGKIIEANNLIELLQKDIEYHEIELNKNINGILNEIEELKTQANQNDKLLFDKKKELEFNLRLKPLFTSLKIGVHLISISLAPFLGPVPLLISSIALTGIGFGIGLVENELTARQSNRIPSFNNVGNAIENYKSNLNNINNNQLKRIQNELNVIEIKTRLENKNNFNIQSNNAISIEKRLELLPNSDEKFKLQYKYAETMKLTVEYQSQMSSQERARLNELSKEAKKNIESNEKLNKNLNTLNKANMALQQTSQLIVDLNLQQNIDSNKITEIEDSIKKNSQKLSSLYELEKNIDDMQNNFLFEMQNSLKSFILSLNDSSQAILGFKKFKIKDELNNMKTKIFNLIQSFQGHNHVSNTINRIENTILTIIDIHSQIETYVEKIEFSNYIAKITSNNNEMINSNIVSLKKTILANVIEERVQQAENAFKLWYFPFDCQKDREEICKNDDDICNTNEYEIYLQTLLDHVKNNKIEINKKDNHIINSEFDKNNPFFEWTSQNYSYEIKRLLAGKKVTLYADINLTQFDAIKFSSLYILIQAENPKINETLNKLLSKLWIDLNYPNEFYYKYKQRNYKVNTDSDGKLLLSYQYGNKSNSNESLKKLATSKPMLSPYAFWTFRIKSFVPNENKLFTEIESLMHENTNFSILLCGQGQHINDDATNDDLFCE